MSLVFGVLVDLKRVSKVSPLGIEIWRELKERAGTYGASIPVSLELFTNQGRCQGRQDQQWTEIEQGWLCHVHHDQTEQCQHESDQVSFKCPRSSLFLSFDQKTERLGAREGLPKTLTIKQGLYLFPLDKSQMMAQLMLRPGMRMSPRPRSENGKSKQQLQRRLQQAR